MRCLPACDIGQNIIRKQHDDARAYLSLGKDIIKSEIPEPLKGKEYIPYNMEDPTETIMKLGLQLRELKRTNIGFAKYC